MMHSAIALLRGEAIIALTTIPAHDNTKMVVVNGCPGVEAAVADPMWRDRKMNSAAAVIPKKIKSTVTSKFKI